MHKTALLALGICALMLAGCPEDVCHGNDDCVDGWVCTPEKKCVKADPLVIANEFLLDAVVDEAYEFFLAASGGLKPYRWEVETEESWLSIEASTGLLGGTPVAAAVNVPVIVRVTDNTYGEGQTATKEFSLSVGYCDPDKPHQCSDRGSCVERTCTCGAGYAGDLCETCAAGFHREVDECIKDSVCDVGTCSGHGECDDSTGITICTCEGGYAGEHCDGCAPGYHDEWGVCVQNQVCLENTCTGHGTCDDSDGVVVCTCDTGYTGGFCEACEVGYHKEGVDCVENEECPAVDPCSGRGDCDDSSGVVVCTCHEGYAGVLCGECAGGYHDDGGQCVRDEVCLENTCSHHGSCEDSTGVVVCTCDVGYEGEFCDTCDAGYQDNDRDGTCLPNCVTSSLDCGPHGTCDESSGTAVCACDEGYDGTYCDTCAPEYEDFGSGCVLFWVSIPGGPFLMGSNSGGLDEQPVHQVDVPAFEMTKTEVTVEQYQACVDDGVCTEPDQCGSDYNWGVAGREDHPVNCIDWFQAVDFCTWVVGRLPAEAEWEYAARGGGQDITYPWGNDSPSCTYAVMNDIGSGCGEGRTWAVCSKTAGNTGQGLCDMAGNVWEWVQDWYHSDYNGAPSDGSAWEDPSGSYRVLRGGSFATIAFNLRASVRVDVVPSYRDEILGCRCAR